MPFSFPASPTVGQQSTQNSRVYQWTGSAWELVASATTFDAGNLTGTVATARLPAILEQSSAVGNSGASNTLNLSSASVQTVSLSANCTFTMPTATAGASLTLILTQGGGYTATFSSVVWSGGTAPTITATSSKKDILVFVSDGTYWYGSALQNF
jgi:hypothetical protein